jgi:hypothetical protein
MPEMLLFCPKCGRNTLHLVNRRELKGICIGCMDERDFRGRDLFVVEESRRGKPEKRT